MSVEKQRPMDESTEDKYVWYVGETIPATSLWVRKDGNEYPVYANTRGQWEWYSFNVEDFENTQRIELSDVFIEWLAHYHRVSNGRIGSAGRLHSYRIKEDEPDAEPEWYETELLNTIGKSGMTPEKEDLIKWAYNQVE